MRKSKDDKNNTTTTITPLTSNETPIEIALQIDKDGMTTASKLYALVDTLLEKYDLVLHKEKLIVSTIFDTK